MENPVSPFSWKDQLASLFSYPEKKERRWLSWVWLAALFLLGVYLWGTFFSWGNFSLNYADWALISGPRFQFLKDAATRLVLPLNISNTGALSSVTNRYLSVPDTFISPQFILLRWMSITQFVFLDVLLMYALGFVGLLRIRTRFKLSALAFTFLFLLFNFNGHILAHYLVGHATWGGYFLFPWFFLLVTDLMDGDHRWSWVAKVAGLLFLQLLQGSFHQYVWELLFLALLGVLIPRNFWMAVKAGAASLLLGMVHILPPALVLGNFDNRLIGGYPSLETLWQALVDLRVPFQVVTPPSMTRPVGDWEYYLYVGLAGAAFLLFFGLYRWLRHPHAGADYRPLALPLAGLTLLSLGYVYQLVELLSIPVFDGERITARMISLVFVFIVCFAAIEFQRWLDQARLKSLFYPASCFAALFVLYELQQNLTTLTLQTAVPLLQSNGFNPDGWYVQNVASDRYYLAAIAIGGVISLLTLVGLVVMARRGERIEASLAGSGRNGKGRRLAPPD